MKVDVVIPVLNEEAQLAESVRALRQHLGEQRDHVWRVVIVDNGSSDRTPEVALSLTNKHPDVTAIRLEDRGRGRALRAAWLTSDADIVSYMDVDLSTNLVAFKPMIDALASGDFQVAIGSRLRRGSTVERAWKREVISRSYNVLIKVFFPRSRFSDAQCGFKALTREAVAELVPIVMDQGWFFDTELLLRAEQKGYKIFEVAVDWVDDLDSRVRIVRTAWDDLKGLVRVRVVPLRRAARNAVASAPSGLPRSG